MADGATCIITEEAGHASDVARRALHDGAELIIAVGGDGTVNEVLNGFFDQGALINPQAELGLVMTGTGSDVQRSLWTAHDIESVIARLAMPAAQAIDIGCCEIEGRTHSVVRYFLNVATLGMSGEVARLVNQSRFIKRFGPRLTYLIPSMMAGLTYRNKDIHVQIDDHPTMRACINSIAICNARYFGGGMMIAPDADMQDGFLDVVTIGDVNAVEMALQLPRVYRGTHLSHRKVAHQRARRISLRMDDNLVAAMNVDGEYFDVRTLTCAIMPQALKIRGV